MRVRGSMVLQVRSEGEGVFCWSCSLFLMMSKCNEVVYWGLAAAFGGYSTRTQYRYGGLPMCCYGLCLQ